MPHFADAALRLAIGDDAEPNAHLADHLVACAACRIRHDDIAANAAFARNVFAAVPLATVPTDGNRVHTHDFARARTRRLPPWLLGASGLAAAAALAFALAFTPLGGLAAQLLSIFEPKAFVPIRITAVDTERFRLLPQLDALGTLHPATAEKPRATSLANAARLAGVTPRRMPPSTVLGDAPPHVIFIPAHVTSFTFEAAKAAAYERRFQRSLPPMAPGVDGSTLTVTVPGAVERRWGTGVVLLEAKTLRVSSRGAPLGVLRDYLLSLPNVPSDVIAQLRAIDDPNALPIPIPAGRESATPVDVNGARALAVGDQTGLGAGVIWQRGGTSFAVFGPLTEDEVVALARSIG